MPALKELLTKPARLGLHEVHAATRVEQARQGRVPAGFKIYSAPPGELLLREMPVVRGSDLADAQAVIDQRTSEPVQLSAQYARAWRGQTFPTREAWKAK